LTEGPGFGNRTSAKWNLGQISSCSEAFVADRPRDPVSMMALGSDAREYGHNAISHSARNREPSAGAHRPSPKHCVAGSRDCHPRSEAWVTFPAGSFINMNESEGNHANLLDEITTARRHGIALSVTSSPCKLPFPRAEESEADTKTPLVDRVHPRAPVRTRRSTVLFRRIRLHSESVHAMKILHRLCFRQNHRALLARRYGHGLHHLCLWHKPLLSIYVSDMTPEAPTVQK
jgi:hypothetical protein